METNHYIYMHKNRINGKVYIGQTNSLKDRWKPSGYKHCIKFYRAIEKYGWDNFEHIVLEENLTLEQANELEEYYIAAYDAINDGYNIFKGGDNKEMSQETLDRLSKKSLELWKDQTYKDKQHTSRLLSWQGEMGESRKAKASQRMKELWKDPEYREKKIKIELVQIAQMQEKLFA